SSLAPALASPRQSARTGSFFLWRTRTAPNVRSPTRLDALRLQLTNFVVKVGAREMAAVKNDEGQQLMLESWTKEQLRIASKVVVPETLSRSIRVNDRYRFMKYPAIDSPLLVGGVDVSFQDEGDEAIAVYVVLSYHSIDSPPRVVHRSHKWYSLSIPYIPSFLAFRETEPLLELISSQTESEPTLKPDAILVDGNGQWHQRKAGIATFVGVKTGIPTIGVGKSFYSIDGLMEKGMVHRGVSLALRSWYAEVALRCKHDSGMSSGESATSKCLVLDSVPLSDVDGEQAEKAAVDQILTDLHSVASGIGIPIKGGAIYNNETLAYALVGHGGNTPLGNDNKHGSRGSKNPIYISIGSNISLEDAVVLCSNLCIARIPEPVREADLYGRQIVRDRYANRLISSDRLA
ncbi:hypothetical protein ACHAWF_009031, partial [Thalassiosira exigua]